MRVVHFGKYYPPYRGGMEQFLGLLARGLVRKGISCEVIAGANGDLPGMTQDDGVLVRRLRMYGTIKSLPVCPGAIGALNRVRADVINLHHPNPLGDLSYLLARPPGRLVVTYHSDVVNQTSLSRLHAPFLQRVLEMADAVVAASPQYVDSSPVLGRYRQKVRVIPYGFDAPEGEAPPVAAHQERRAPQYLFIGRLVPYKGIAILLRALPRISGNLWIIGSGPLEPKLRKQASEPHLAGRVEFLGSISESEKFQRLASCDVLVLPSVNRAEAFGIVLLEAMAMGRPVVASDLASGVQMLVQHGVNGLRFPPGDDRALAEALQRLANDGALARRMGEAGRRLVREHYSVPRMVDRYGELYKELCP